MSDIRYWIAGSQAFGYTPHRQSDGKFYAIKYRYDKTTGSGASIKKRIFGRRKKARETAYHWYCQRKAVLEKLASAKPKKPEPTKAEILQQKVAKCEAQIKTHTTKLKLQKTLIRKWERKKKYYSKKLKELRA
jgi:hypothetical protein